jgi:hypothetical protein
MYELQVQKIKKLEIDEAYANEALNKNLLKRLEIAFKITDFSKQQFVQLGFFVGKLNYLLLFEK